MRKHLLKDGCLREIKRELDKFYKYPDLYSFHAKTQEEQEIALLKEIKGIIRRYEVIRKFKSEEVSK